MGRRAPFAAGLILASLLSAAALEGLARLIVPLSARLIWAVDSHALPPILRGVVRPDDEIGYGLVPGYEGQGGSAERPIALRINSLGMRDREYDLKGADAARRFVLGVGDSFAFGAGIEVEDSFLSRLEGALRSDVPSIAVIKAGVPGYNLIQSTKMARRHAEAFAPDLVLLQVIPQTEHRNLVPQRAMAGMIVIPRKGWHYYESADGVFASPLRPGFAVSLDMWGVRVSYAYRLARGIGASLLLPSDRLTGSENALARERGLEALGSLERHLHQRGIPLLVILNNWAPRPGSDWDALDDANGAYEAYCRENDIAAIDTLHAFRAETERSGYLGLTEYNSHWSPEGHQLAAGLIAEFIARYQLLSPSALHCAACRASPGE